VRGTPQENIMKKWFLGVLTGFFLAYTLLMLAGLAGVFLGPGAPSVADNTTLILELSGDIPEQTLPDIAGELLGEPQPPTMIPLLRNIEKAAADRRVTGILLKPTELQMGWAKLQQLRQALEDFQARGKRLTAILTTAGTAEYYLASVADTVYLSPGGVLDLKGMRAEVMFFKDGLGKLGVQADMEQIGRYKNLADQFEQSRMSDAFREATTSMLDSVYNGFLATVAEARGMPIEEMQATVESGPFDPERAQLANLVDELQYEDQVMNRLGLREENDAAHQLEFDRYALVPRSDVGLDGDEKIAVVYAVGTITSGQDSGDPLQGGKTMGAETMAETLDAVSKDDSIKGVVVRIDSPGGDAFASDEIWRRMNLLSEKKPVVFSMSDLAASGGYYLAMTGDSIVAEPGTLTGSIGIIYGKLNLKGLYDKLGIYKEIISRGPLSTLDSDYGPFSNAERERVRALIDDFYEEFIGKVAAARGMTPDEVDLVAQGRVWTGEQAVENGLVDELGGFNRALELVKEKAKIASSESVQIVEYPRRKTLLELLLSRAQRAEFRSSAELRLPAPLARWLADWRQLETMAERPLWAWLPLTFSFH
jgi:protease-4